MVVSKRREVKEGKAPDFPLRRLGGALRGSELKVELSLLPLMANEHLVEVGWKPSGDKRRDGGIVPEAFMA